MARELAFFLSLNAGPDGGRRRFRGAGIVPRQHFRVMASAFPTCRLCAASAFPECAQPRAHNGGSRAPAQWAAITLRD